VAPLIIAAAFSAIMIVGALVLVEVTAGITEASTTLIGCEPIAGAEARGLVEFAELAILEAAQPRTQHGNFALNTLPLIDLFFLGREQVETLEIVVGAVRQK
jgi:hypothetical protein